MRKVKPPVTPEDVEDAISDWEEALRWIAKGWDCHEEYDHDVYSRELLDTTLTEYGKKPLPPELTQRIAQADQFFREITEESDSCVADIRNSKGLYLDRERYWYYYRWQRDAK